VDVLAYWDGPLGDSYREAGDFIKGLNATGPIYVGETGIIGYQALGVDLRDYFGVIYPRGLSFNHSGFDSNLNGIAVADKPQYIFVWPQPPGSAVAENYTVIEDFYSPEIDWHYVMYERNDFVA
jgi:hypothetical protein